MAGGPILPSSTYLGAGAGNLYPAFYIPNTNTNSAGAFEGIGVVQSLGTTQSAVLQFNLPESLPTGTLKCRHLAMANATSGNAVITLNDAVTPAGSNIGASTLTPETQYTKTWATADILVEQKTTLTTAAVANSIYTVRVDFIGAGAVWTLAQASVHQFSLIWE